MLNQDATNYTVQLLKDGFDAGQIVTKIRSQFACGIPRTRLFYTTTKDIRNIAEKHGIVPARLHSNDIISVEARVDRKLPEDGIRYYEPWKPKTGDGFVMGRHFVLPFKDDDNIRDACEGNNNYVIDVLSGNDSIYSDKENRQESETDRMDRNKENLQRIETCWSRIKAYSFEIPKSSEGADILDHIADGMQKICLDIVAREER
ncbi:unnamed protein product, partial [Heligmosomoides polygyrus]|uniref:Methyltransferase n=1 Tax=Heligmosomoides polygyrus TaxID=6339 RepID=A0A183FLH5_HELPZ